TLPPYFLKSWSFLLVASHIGGGGKGHRASRIYTARPAGSSSRKAIPRARQAPTAAWCGSISMRKITGTGAVAGTGGVPARCTVVVTSMYFSCPLSAGTHLGGP